MKKLFFAVALLTVSTFSFAQGFGGGQGMNMDPEDMAKRQVDRINEQVTLTKAQQDTLTVFFVAQSKAQQARREKMQQDGGQQGQGFSEEMMKEMQTQREAQEAKIKSVLTEEQYKKYQAAQEERRQRMQQNGGGFGGGFGGGAPQR